MAHTLHNVEGLEYIAGRTFTLNGEKYESGDPVPNEELANTHLEALIRSRHVIPVVDDEADIPRYTNWREIKVRARALDKLGKEDKRPAKKAAAKKSASKKDEKK